MIVNTYFLKDPKTIECHVNTDLEDVLAVIENLVDSYHCDDIIIAGDLNIFILILILIGKMGML